MAIRHVQAAHEHPLEQDHRAVGHYVGDEDPERGDDPERSNMTTTAQKATRQNASTEGSLTITALAIASQPPPTRQWTFRAEPAGRCSRA